MIALSAGAAEVGLLPEVGGSIGWLRFEGRDVLRPTPADATDPLATACFPLVPFANRIAHGRFRTDGREVQLPPNVQGFVHPLHGYGWLAPWQVTFADRDSARLTSTYEPGDWPWSWTAEQEFRLAEGRLDVALTLRNASRESMPASIGFHPYFPKTERTTLTASVEGVWLSNREQIPSEPARPDRFLNLARGVRLAGAPFVDHCHWGWKGSAIVDSQDTGVRVALSGSPELSFLHLYLPANESFFCAEPVSAMPDAFNRSESSARTGLRVLAPGAALRVEMRLAFAHSSVHE